LLVGPDTDSDGTDDDCDSDDDGDGVADGADNAPLDNSVCSDTDADGCDDCSVGGSYTPNDDGLDTDSDGTCNVGDTDDDGDGCADGADDDPLLVGPDTDSDGTDDDCDSDDDNDGVDDVNATGHILDLCPFSPLDASDVDENGCDATERDSDSDGIMDSEDQCQGTPIGNVVNAVGCADLDGDGVFSNVDICPSTMGKWTPDSVGCAVYQLPITFSEAGGYGRMTKFHRELPKRNE
jgi:hypothetical protein